MVIYMLPVEAFVTEIKKGIKCLFSQPDLNSFSMY